MSIKFKCLKCGCEKLEEVMYGVTQFSLIDSLDEDGAIDYTMNGISYEDGNVQYYQCNKCGFIVGDKDYKVNCETIIAFLIGIVLPFIFYVLYRYFKEDKEE